MAYARALVAATKTAKDDRDPGPLQAALDEALGAAMPPKCAAAVKARKLLRKLHKQKADQEKAEAEAAKKAAEAEREAARVAEEEAAKEAAAAKQKKAEEEAAAAKVVILSIYSVLLPHAPSSPCGICTRFPGQSLPFFFSDSPLTALV